MSPQTSLRKSLKRKDICLNRFLIQTKVTYSGKNCHKKTFISKGKKRASGFKPGRNRLTLFCAIAGRFMIKTALIYKVAKSGALKGKVKYKAPVFWLYKKGLNSKNPFYELVPFMLCP